MRVGARARGGYTVPRSTCLRCHRLTALGESYCATHAPKAKPRPDRPTRQARGLGADYQRNRAITLSVSRTCILCGRGGADTADHLTPRHQGGTNHLTNLAPAHHSCNSGRRERPLTAAQRKRADDYLALLSAWQAGHSPR